MNRSLERRFSIIFLFLILLAPATNAQVTYNEQIEVSAISVPVAVRDVAGQLPRDLTSSDFILTEDGIEQKIIGLRYDRAVAPNAVAPDKRSVAARQEEPWQVVIFVQQTLSSTFGLRIALSALSGEAEQLTSLGDVEVVGDAGGAPHTLIGGTRDAAALRRSLRELAGTIRGSAEIVRLRREFLADGRNVGSNPFQKLSTARIESIILSARMDAFLRWVHQHGAAGRARALLFVTDGYDTDPAEFYHVTDTDARAEMVRLNAAPRQQEIARALAAAGWTVLSFAPGWMTTMPSPTFDVSNSGRGRARAFLRNPDLGSSTPISTNLHPLDPLQILSDATGGGVLTNGRKLGRELAGMTDRIVLTYLLQRRRDGALHRIDVKSRRRGLTVHAQKWVVTGTPDIVAASRASALASGSGSEHGELPVRCMLAVEPPDSSKEGTVSRVEATVDLSPLDAIRSSLSAATLRFTFAIQSSDSPPVTRSKRVERADLTKHANWHIDFQLLHHRGARVAVVAEEMATGAWGGGVCVSRLMRP